MPSRRPWVVIVVGSLTILATCLFVPWKENFRKPAESKPPASFHFKSLKGQSDDDLANFMSGKPTPGFLFPADAQANHFPEHLWNSDPMVAALEFANANRTPGHRKLFKLTVNNDPAIKAPDAGWLILDSGSAICYSNTQNFTALCFGVEQPFLLIAGANIIGSVGHNPYTDRYSHSLKLIPLTPEEARFLAHTIFWLEHIRSEKAKEENSEKSLIWSALDASGLSDWLVIRPTPVEHGDIWCSADGFGMLDWYVGNQALRQIGETLWSSPISSRWRNHYNSVTTLNHTCYLITTALPKHLGKRWESGNPLSHADFVMPLAERLKPRVSEADREHLNQVILTGIARHFDDPWPGPALVELVKCAGDAGLRNTLPALEELAAQLPPPSADEVELDALKDRFLGRYTAPEDPEEKKPWQRYEALRNQLDDVFHPRLRRPLNQAIRQLRALDKTPELIEMAKSDAAGAIWAIQQLQLLQPDAHAEVLATLFCRASEKRDRVRIFETLATANPPATRGLRDSLNAQEQAELMVQISQFESTDNPASARKRIPALLEIVLNPNKSHEWEERTAAIDLLVELPLNEPQQVQFERLLIDELSSPHPGGYTISNTAAALLKQPEPDRFWDALMQCASSTIDQHRVGSLLEALAVLAIASPEPRLAQLTGFLRNRLTHHIGDINQVSRAALALDMRMLSPALQQLATSGPQVTDGEYFPKCGGDPKASCHHRYHSARHVIALWLEQDADTLARMWTALLLESPYAFVGSGFLPSSLRDRCSSAIAAASPELRRRLVVQARSNPHLSRELPDWLADLPTAP